jgi:hypothetical protein
MAVIMPQDSSSNYYYIFSKVTQNFGSYRLKDDLNVGTIATRWLVTQVMKAYHSKHRISSGEIMHVSAWPMQRTTVVQLNKNTIY